MGRPKGSKKKNTKTREQEMGQDKEQVQERIPFVKKRRVKVKKIIDTSNTDKIRRTLEEARKQGKGWTEKHKTELEKSLFSHVLVLEYPYFIQATSTCYVLKQFVDKKDENGEYRQPISLCYAGRLGDMLKVCVTRLIRIPSNVEECARNIERIFDMIDARIENLRPRDLFEDYKTAHELKERMMQLEV